LIAELAIADHYKHHIRIVVIFHRPHQRQWPLLVLELAGEQQDEPVILDADLFAPRGGLLFQLVMRIRKAVNFDGVRAGKQLLLRDSKGTVIISIVLAHVEARCRPAVNPAQNHALHYPT